MIWNLLSFSGEFWFLRVLVSFDWFCSWKTKNNSSLYWGKVSLFLFTHPFFLDCVFGCVFVYLGFDRLSQQDGQVVLNRFSACSSGLRRCSITSLMSLTSSRMFHQMERRRKTPLGGKPSACSKNWIKLTRWASSGTVYTGEIFALCVITKTKHGPFCFEVSMLSIDFVHKAFKISNGSRYLILAFKTTMFVSGIGFISIPPINTAQCGRQSKSLCNCNYVRQSLELSVELSVNSRLQMFQPCWAFKVPRLKPES